jgi:hypothetical protein
MTYRFTIAIAPCMLLLCVSCVASNHRYSVAPGSGQGTYVVNTEPNPMSPPTPSAPATGPSEHEIELERHINQLEARQKELQTEIDRLRSQK